MGTDPLEDRGTVPEGVDTYPYQVDAAGVSLAHRPRLYWLSWELVPEEGLALSEWVGEHWNAYRVAKDYVEPGWAITADQRLPTFTTAGPSETPGRKPAGLSRCDLPTKSRWREDKHRYPPYQYRAENCLKHSDGRLRPATIAERETILGSPCTIQKIALPKAIRWERLTLI